MLNQYIRMQGKQDISESLNMFEFNELFSKKKSFAEKIIYRAFYVVRQILREKVTEFT